LPARWALPRIAGIPGRWRSHRSPVGVLWFPRLRVVRAAVVGGARYCAGMQPSQPTRWEYATVPLLVHATKQILDNWGDDGWELAARCALNALAAIDALVGLDQVVRVVKVTGFVASAGGFTGQPGVLNGASDLFGAVFGDAGRHVRSAVGVAELPLGAPVEVEVIVEVT